MLGEELSPTGELDGLVWIVDPLDGTTNFLHGVPVVGGVDRRGGGRGARRRAWCSTCPRGRALPRGAGRRRVAGRHGGLPVSVRIADPALALIGTGFPFKHLDRIDEYQRQFAAVAGATSGIRRPGAASLDLVDVAAGRFDGFWELMLAPWDIAAGMLLVREAGGVVTDLAGRTVGPEHTGRRGGESGDPRVVVGGGRYSFVKIRGPFAVIATVCSKCADRLPSAVTTVHLSGSVRVAGSPMVIIGSMAMVIPSRSRGPRFGMP